MGSAGRVRLVKPSYGVRGIPRRSEPAQVYPVAEEQTVAALADRITVDPDQCGGRPCVRGLRIRVTDVLDLLAAGLSPSQVLEELPDLEIEDIRP